MVTQQVVVLLSRVQSPLATSQKSDPRSDFCIFHTYGTGAIYFLYRKMNDRFFYLEMRLNAVLRLYFQKEFGYYNSLQNDDEDDPDALKIKNSYQQKTIVTLLRR